MMTAVSIGQVIGVRRYEQIEIKVKKNWRPVHQNQQIFRTDKRGTESKKDSYVSRNNVRGLDGHAV